MFRRNAFDLKEWIIKNRGFNSTHRDSIKCLFAPSIRDKIVRDNSYKNKKSIYLCCRCFLNTENNINTYFLERILYLRDAKPIIPNAKIARVEGSGTLT